jgi:hypothetical protein
MKKEIETLFFRYHQNNTGGYYNCSYPSVARVVIVEAKNSEEADRIAEDSGLYFDGSGDCRCCGKRWSQNWEDGTETPSNYGTPIEEEYKEVFSEKDWEEHLSVIYYDGKIRTFNSR